LWTALHALDGYLISQGAWLVITPSVTARAWYRDHRRNGQFPGEPPDEQIPTDAVVTARRGSAASGSLRCL
jgi:hypothetical protein